MLTYPKIDTLFNRKSNFGVDVNQYRRPEYGIINRWVLTEKIDGTNIRIEFLKGHGFDIGGRTDSADIPKELHARLLNLGANVNAAAEDIMARFGLNSITLFGEGYGPKIQSGGRYRNDPSFILFDVLVNDKVWLSEDAITDTAKNLGIDRVPILETQATIDRAIQYCGGDIRESAFISTIAQDRTYFAEGVVAKTIVPLYDNRGERVMWKLKARDFK